MNDESKKEIKAILDSASGWNNGHGLIIPHHIAKIIEEAGIEAHYTVSGLVPPKDKEAI